MVYLVITILKFSAECSGEKILNIGQYLVMMWTKICGLLFRATLYVFEVKKSCNKSLIDMLIQLRYTIIVLFSIFCCQSVIKIQFSSVQIDCIRERTIRFRQLAFLLNSLRPTTGHNAD